MFELFVGFSRKNDLCTLPTKLMLELLSCRSFKAATHCSRFPPQRPLALREHSQTSILTRQRLRTHWCHRLQTNTWGKAHRRLPTRCSAPNLAASRVFVEEYQQLQITIVAKPMHCEQHRKARDAWVHAAARPNESWHVGLQSARSALGPFLASCCSEPIPLPMAYH